MLIEFLTYNMKVAMLLVVFYLFYRLLIGSAPYHKLNRWVLLLSLVLSLVLPLCVITVHRTVWVAASSPAMALPPSQPVVLPFAEENFGPLAERCLAWLIVAGFAVRLLLVGRSFLELRKLISECEIFPQADGTVMAVTRKPVKPFSWMHTIVMNHHDYAEHNAAVLAHERGHISCHHSLDVIFVELLTALQWFNPAVWFLRQDLRGLHEMEADQAVLSQGFPVELYVQLLFRKATGLPVSLLANAMSRQILKKRILIMLNNHPNRYTWLRAMYVVPVVALSLAATARTVVEYKTINDIPAEERTLVWLRQQPVGKETTSALADSNANKPETAPNAPWKNRPMAFSDSVLVILDGVPVSKEDVALVQKELITSVNVLSKEKAVAVYGEKGSCGAVVITTDRQESGQNSVDDNDMVFDMCEQMPKFVQEGGDLFKYLSKHLAYPKQAHELGVQGRVIVQFVVEKDGSLSNIRVLRPEPTFVDGRSTIQVVKYASGMTDEERALVDKQNEAWQLLGNAAVTLVRNMPRWQPGMQNGNPVRCKFVIPITFRLA